MLSQHTIYTKTVQINSFLCVYLWCIPPNTVIQMKIDNQHTIPPLPHTVIQIICKYKAKNRLSTQFIQRQICKLYRKKSCLCVQNYMCTTRSMNIVNEGNTGSWAGPHPQFRILNRNLFDPNKVGQVQIQNGHWEKEKYAEETHKNNVKDKCTSTSNCMSSGIPHKTGCKACHRNRKRDPAAAVVRLGRKRLGQWWCICYFTTHKY